MSSSTTCQLYYLSFSRNLLVKSDFLWLPCSFKGWELRAKGLEVSIAPCKEYKASYLTPFSPGIPGSPVLILQASVH